jgi:RimJ/RimL family protein N-acetyltransferase
LEHLHGDDWSVLREARLRALRDSGESFAGSYAEESGFAEQQWRDQLEVQDWCAVLNGQQTAAIMGVDVVERHECNCWVHGCWVDPAFRGRGLTRMMVEWLDALSLQREWVRQGLGVWPENIRAVSVWERLGFEIYGTPQPSRRRPGQVYVAMRREVPALQRA